MYARVIEYPADLAVYIAVMGNWIQVHELNWIQFTKYESR